MAGIRPDVLLVVAAIIVALVWMYRRDRRHALDWRSGLLDDCAPLLDPCRLQRDALGFPVLDGRYRDQPVEIRLIADTVGVRRLPSLWLVLTIKSATALGATIDCLARARNTEFYSPADELPHRLPPLPGCPPDLQVKSDRADLELAVLTPGIAGFFSESCAKELLVTPRGLRLVYLLDQARRSDYLVLRSASFETGGPAAPLVERLLEQALELHAAAALPVSTIRHAA